MHVACGRSSVLYSSNDEHWNDTSWKLKITTFLQSAAFGASVASAPIPILRGAVQRARPNTDIAPSVASCSLYHWLVSFYDAFHCNKQNWKIATAKSGLDRQYVLCVAHAYCAWSTNRSINQWWNDTVLQTRGVVLQCKPVHANARVTGLCILCSLCCMRIRKLTGSIGCGDGRDVSTTIS